MAKLHSGLLNAELHNPKGITSNSTASIMELNQAQSAISSSADFVPTTTATYDLGSATLPWKEIFVTTSSINFVDPSGATIQKMQATPAGVTFTSGSGAVANVSASIISGSALHVEGNAKVTGNLTLGGQITLGDADSDDVVFEAEVSSSIIPDADNTYDLGSSGKQWKDIYINGVGYIDSLGTDGDPVTAYINAGEIDGVTLGAESAVSNITSDGTISGSAVYGTTIGQNRTDGLKTITIEANSIINQDLSTDATATLGTLAVGNVTSTGIVSGSSVYGTTIGQNRVDGLKTITIESNSTVNQDLTTDAGPRFETIEVGAATDTTIAREGAGDITIEGNHIYRVGGTDVSVADGGTGASTLTSGYALLGNGTSAPQMINSTADSNLLVGNGSTMVAESGATLRTSIGVGTTDDVSFGSLISGSADLWVGDTTNYVSASGGTLKVTGAITGSSVRASDIRVGVTAANEIDTQVGNLILDSAGGTVQVTDTLDIDGDISLVTQATDIDLVDANTSALSFDAAGKAGILEIDTSDGAEKVKMSGGLEVTGTTTGATISGSSIDGTAIRHNTATGLHSLVLNEDLTVSDGTAVIITSADQTNTVTLNESFTIGGGNTGTLTYSGASKTLTVEDSATVDQDLTKDANVQFQSLVLDGDLTAQRLIVSSSVSNVTQSFSSGSTIFGDTYADDTHQFTGSAFMGNLEVSGTLSANADSLYNIGASGVQFANVFTDNLTLDGQGRIDLDDDLDTSIRASGDDIITFEAAGADQVAFTDGTIEPVTSDDIALGTTSKMFSDVFLGGGGVVNWNNGNMTLSHAAGILDVAGGTLRVAGVITGSTDLVVGDVSNTKTYISASGGNLKVSHDIFAQDYSGSTAAFGSNITSEGTISGSAVYGTTIGQNRVDGVKTLTIEANSIINQDLSTDANATLGTLGVGNVTSTGIVSGSSVYGTTIGQTRTDGLKTITIEANSTINQDVTTDAGPRFETIELGAATDNTISRAGAGDLNIEGNLMYRAGGTDVPVADGGTGASTLTSGYALLGNGTSAPQMINSTADSTLLVGNGSTMVAETGATLRTSLGVGTTDSVSFGSLVSGSADLFVGAKGTNYISGSGGNFEVSGKISASSAGFTDVSASTAEFTTATITGGTITGITDLTVADGGTGVSSFTVKSVIVSDDSTATADLAPKQMDGSGELLIGGSSGPEVGTITGGNGLTMTVGDGSIAIGLDAALTTVTSMYNTALKVGRDASGDWVDFGTDDNIKVYLNNAEEFRFASGGTFHADADVVAYSSTVASDMNLKKNITDMKYGLDTVMQLRGVEYDWKREDMGHDVGVLAQEVEAVIPELVKEHEGLNGRGKFKSVDYNKLVPVLIESIKELKKEIDDLKSN